jgi:hypothetical protein
MLNARKCMRGVDTRGMFPLRVQGVKLQRIYGRNYLASDANCVGKRLVTRKRELTIGSIMQA